MVNGIIVFFRVGVIMDYSAPADLAVMRVNSVFFDSVVDSIQAQIIDVGGKGSRRTVALTINAREII